MTTYKHGMFINATFVGPAPSLGFIPKQLYRLRVTQFKGKPIAIVCIEDMRLVCEYDTITGFLENWDNLHIMR